jgi:hypothetical protein
MVCLRNDPDRLVVDRSYFEFFYQLNRDHSNNYGRSDNAKHMETLQTEHFLDPEPRYYFSFDEQDAKEHTGDEKLYVRCKCFHWL